MFSGGAFKCLGYGIGNYALYLGFNRHTALGIAIPYFQRLQREGESGRRKMNQITRYLTVAILILQSPAYLANLSATLPADALL